MTAFYAIVLFVLLIFPHELGHFLVAKAVGVKVNEFAFGMGPAIFKKQKGETQYSIRIFPIGGFCAMEGEDEDSENPRAFTNKSAKEKIAVLFAGAGMNILIAVFVMSLIFTVVGQPNTSISEIQKGTPAYEADLQPGDIVKKIDNTEINKWEDLSTAIGHDKKSHDFVIERNGETITKVIKPELSEDGSGRYVIGILPGRSHNIGKAIVSGTKATVELFKLMIDSFRMLFTGSVPVSDLAGPIGIVTMAGDSVQYGMVYFGQLIALMSVNLAIINLLPLPALDGGRILFCIIRKIGGERISDAIEGKIHAIGMLLLLCLMVFVTWNDIVRLFT